MVAVTIVLAAAIGVFVLDIGQSATEKIPSASFEFEYDDSGATDQLSITHKSGENLDRSSLSIKADDTVIYDGGSGQSSTTANTNWPGEVSGDTLVLEDTGSDFSSGTTIYVVWQGGDKSSVLGQRELS